MKRVFFSAMVALAMAAGTACSSTSTEGEGAAMVETSSAATDSAEVAAAAADTVSTEQFAYICPMECEGSASHQPGKCPVCGMDLAENPNYKPADNSLK